MQDDVGRDELALERTLLAAERTFSAWIRTGLAALGGGLAVGRVFVFTSDVHQIVSHVIGGLIVIWGAGIIVYAILSYRRACARLSQNGIRKNSLGVMIWITSFLLIIAALVFWMTLQ